MLDELLGRAELKRQIEELQEEKHHLERHVEAEEERRSDAASARQAAEERVNRLEDRLTSLQDTVDRLQAQSTETSQTVRSETDLSGEALGRFCDQLRSVQTGPEGALTVTVTDERALPESVTEAFDGVTELVRRAAPGIAYADDFGLIRAVVRPPIHPEQIDRWESEFVVDRRWFEPTGSFAFGVVRSDLFALGEYDERTRQTFTGFESDVKSDHSKGGYSQGRFERIRDEQIADHLDRVEETLRDRNAEKLILVGEQTVLDDLDVGADVVQTTDARGKPKDALEQAFHDFWTARVYVF
ncbi:hypothetical protein HUB97_00035 [Halorubraceae archaeon YAN]|nr:hypothetical protein [Halorubraceae archaeon YAN]